MTCEKLYGVKTIRLLECHHALAHQEGSKPDFRWCTLSEFLNIADIFWSCFLLDTAFISKEDFLSNTGMCFGGVVVAIDTVLRSLKGKYYWESIKVGGRICQGMSQKCSDQNTKVVRFYLCTVTIPYLSGANDRIEIDNFCSLMSCSKRIYK